jgi:hypothetical protein
MRTAIGWQSSTSCNMRSRRIFQGTVTTLNIVEGA